MLAITRTELFTIKRALTHLAFGDEAQELLADSYEIIDSILEKNIEVIVPESAVRLEQLGEDEIEVEDFPFDEDFHNNSLGDDNE